MPWGSDILVSPDQSFIHKQVIRYVISQVQAIGCDCQHVKKKILALTRYPNQRIWVIPWGIELSRFHPMPTSNRGKVRRRLGWEDKKILIMTRNLWDVYGHRFLIDALPAILQAEPDTRLILCGAGYLERELQERVRALDLNGYVHFAGFVPNEELPLYLNDSNVYVSPSLSDGTSASLLEAMACGLPVVVTDVPAILEWVTPDYNGLVVQRQDAVALAESLIRILRDETIREEMGKRNLVISCDRADWNKNFVEFENLYDHLADEYSSLRGRKAGRAIPCVF
jgi:glycosyltransferase involved in cell wall biosynthesis